MTPDLQTQTDFEQLFHKNQLIPRLKREFNVPEVIMQCEKKEIPTNFGIDLLVQMVLHKRAPVNVLVGILYKHFKHLENPYQECADMLLKAAQENFVNYDTFSGMFIMRFDVTPDVYEELDRYQYPLPCMIPPKTITNNKQNGYYSYGVQTSLLLRNNHHDDDICIDHINRANSIKLTINTDTANMIANEWKDLDKKKEGESKEDYQKRVRAFERYDRSSKDVIDALVLHGNEFYLTHRYDKRGRVYCQGYHVNYQGNPWNKAVVEFAHQEVCNG